ncbi:glycosyltransferase [Labrys monachus]|uniref:GT2 family glycosyltransferase n=1 Tax=Labrys monachus TaxID=217067 RepID=A0ABU0FA26_9HYPH|nr:glycosyltransferase [Labrys monachus]MDQ0391445.1 GT2 family glycosyltransferase [Labrys monachus]
MSSNPGASHDLTPEAGLSPGMSASLMTADEPAARLSAAGQAVAADGQPGPAPARPARLAVALATIGRPDVVVRTVGEIKAQTRRPDEILVCAPTERDVGNIADLHPDVRLLIGRLGLTTQRNYLMENLEAADIVVFLDDDFIPDAHYLEFVETLFARYPDVVMTTGRVLADGILGPGLDFASARTAIDAAAGDPHDIEDVRDVYNGYGCNMAIRLDPVRRHNIRFDEKLPLYGWLEDVDFSRQLARYGRIIKAAATRGVHLGVKGGRQTGTRLGYSQIANPFYLMRKGTCSPAKALTIAARNVLANLVRSIRPEPHVDRRGRISGNSRALLDLLTGRLSPGRVLSL